MQLTYLLHFDINRTLIVEDIAGGKTRANILNAVLSEKVFGRLATPPSGPPTWEMISQELSNTAPSLSEEDRAAGFRICSYRRFCRIKNPSGAGEPGLSPEERKARMLAARKRRQAEVDSFTSLGQFAKFFPVFEDMCRVLDDALCRSSSGIEFNILPSFFHFVAWMQRQGHRFSIIFRTFGQDGPEIAKQWNEFCSGLHPRFPDLRMDGSGGSVDRRIQLGSGFATMKRTGFESQHTAMELADGPLVGYDRIYDLVLRTGLAEQTFAIRDDFSWWETNREADEAGKLFLLGPRDIAHPLCDSAASGKGAWVHQIFFDDNITMNILDGRDLDSEEHIVRERMDRVAVNVDTMDAILDLEYFIKCFRRCCGEDAIQP